MKNSRRKYRIRKSGNAPLSRLHKRIRKPSWLDSVQMMGQQISGTLVVEEDCCHNIIDLLQVGVTIFGILSSGGGGGFDQEDAGLLLMLLFSDVSEIDPSSYQENSSGYWEYASSSNFTKRAQKVLPELDGSKPIIPMTNIAGTWESDAVESKIAVNSGGAYQMISLCTLSDHHATLGVGTDYNGNMFAFGAYLTPEKARVTDPVALPLNTSSCALEIDINHKTGQTTFWINDTGLDMGRLEGFKGGAHFGLWGGGATSKADHMLSGSFTNCATASKNLPWVKANLSKDTLLGYVPPHVQLKPKDDIMSVRDLRSVVV